MKDQDATAPTALPAPARTGSMSVEEAIAKRRTVREFSPDPLTREQLAQLCWAGQGVTDAKGGLRTVPSAGALYPIELYVAAATGVDHYQPANHSLEHHLADDVRPALQAVSLNQEMISQAPVSIVIAAEVERTSRKYGNRAERYCFIEAGHVAQNILLQAAALGLAGVPIGAFDDRQLGAVLKLPKGQRVLYFLAIGHPRR